LEIFLAFGFPYILVVSTAYVGARVVYTLGTEVTRARELGSYRLEDRLGQGGMGEVWRASHRLLARPAAIKLIRSSVPGNTAGVSDDMKRRFEREAQVIAQLRSPHTVTLFDFGIADEGSFYYVMELLEGVDTDGRYGEDHDFVKVLDFGLAKAMHETSSETQTAITIGNVIQGTPAFIAPEQALDGADVDARADIYSTGCVAYWLLTGQLVFTADTAMKTLLAHAHSLPEPPSSRTGIPIPPDLEALVLACLAKDREYRPQTARDLLQRLDAVALQQPWTDARARDWWNVHLRQQPHDS
jgi:serine/threonine-protein kinase